MSDDEALIILSVWQRETAERLRSRMPEDEWTAYESDRDIPDDPDDYLAEADEEGDEEEE